MYIRSCSKCYGHQEHEMATEIRIGWFYWLTSDGLQVVSITKHAASGNDVRVLHVLQLCPVARKLIEGV